MSLGSRLIVLLFVTKVLGTCTCSCTWLKKIDVLDAIQVLQIFFELVLANLKSTWLLLDSSTSESTWPQPCQCTSPLAALKYVYQADKNCDVLKACSWIAPKVIDWWHWHQAKIECVLPWHMELILMLVTIKFTSARIFAPSCSSRCTRLWLA